MKNETIFSNEILNYQIERVVGHPKYWKSIVILYGIFTCSIQSLTPVRLFRKYLLLNNKNIKKYAINLE